MDYKHKCIADIQSAKSKRSGCENEYDRAVAAGEKAIKALRAAGKHFFSASTSKHYAKQGDEIWGAFFVYPGPGYHHTHRRNSKLDEIIAAIRRS